MKCENIKKEKQFQTVNVLVKKKRQENSNVILVNVKLEQNKIAANSYRKW